MNDSTAFDFVSIQLEYLSDMTEMQARGTLRLALKKAGLNSETVKAEQMQVVVNELLTSFLTKRRVEHVKAKKICENILKLLQCTKIPSPK